jgi:hypothetical protein
MAFDKFLSQQVPKEVVQKLNFGQHVYGSTTTPVSLILLFYPARSRSHGIV